MKNFLEENKNPIFLVIFLIAIMISNLYYKIQIDEILRYAVSLSLIFLLLTLPFLILQKRATIKLNIFALVSFLIILLFLVIKIVYCNHYYIISWSI